MSWTDRIFENKSAVGIEVTLTEEDKIFNYSVLKKIKDSFELIFLKSNERQVEPGNIPGSAHVSIIINGKGIIHKKVHASENADDRFLLSQVLPAANPDDFFLQKVRASGDNVFLSVIRKNIVNNILDNLKTFLPKNEVVRVSLGPFSVLRILALIGQEQQNEIRFSNHYLSYLPGGIIHEYLNEKVDADFKFNSMTLPGSNLLSFAAAYQNYLKDSDYSISNIPLVIQSKKRLKEKKNFELMLGGVLCFFLLLLITNYFIFDYYWNKKNELSATFILNQDAFSKLEKLKSDFTEKQNFLEATGFFEPSHLSFYADQIALDLPESILLTQINLNPAKTKLKEKGDISFNNKKINVSGTCRKSIEINEWIKSLKKKKWVRDLVMVNYSFDKDKQLADFTLEITAKIYE